MVEVVVVADMEEVVDTEEAVVAVVDEVSSNICPSPVPSADGTNKVVGRRFHLFQFCSSRWRTALVKSPITFQVIRSVTPISNTT